jgi:Invasin, domain 3/PKD domain
MFSVFMISRSRVAALTLLPVLMAVCQKVPLLAPSGSVITLTSSATVLPLNGSLTLAAQVIEASGNPPHSGTHVGFTTTLGTIQPSDAETDKGGVAKATFTAGTQSGTATITAISGGVSSGSITVSVAGRSTVIVTPAPPRPGLPADVAVQIQVTSPAGVTITSTTINWGDGSPDESVGAISGTVTIHHFYTAAAAFTITVTVTDSLGVETKGNATVTVSS